MQSKNPVTRHAALLRYRKKHPENIRANHRRYKERHPERYRQQKRRQKLQKRLKRLERDPAFRKRVLHIRWSKHPLKQWARRKSRSYRLAHGITLRDVRIMLRKQGRVCVLCGYSLSLRNRSTHVDHCHVTGRIRGILCNYCNTRLGWFEKNKSNVLSYLRPTWVLVPTS